MHWRILVPDQHAPGSLVEKPGCMRPGRITGNPRLVDCPICRCLPSHRRALADVGGPEGADVIPITRRRRT